MMDNNENDIFAGILSGDFSEIFKNFSFLLGNNNKNNINHNSNNKNLNGV
jgi:hypothetical protein